MGEYATLNGAEIKIGTCEDMFYLRADQAHLVRPVQGSLDPRNPKIQTEIRFRFPWPDEDDVQPGEFRPFGRSLCVPGIQIPAGVEHDTVQFSAEVGYLVSLPCPEGAGMPAGLTIRRNGFAGAFHLVQQAYRKGVLALIGRCGGCGVCFNLPTWGDAEPVVVAIRAEADRITHTAGEGGSASVSFLHTVADRITAGYKEPRSESRKPKRITV